MNLTPIYQKLDKEDFAKVLKMARRSKEVFYLMMARNDPNFQYHVDLPPDEGQSRVEPMEEWLNNPERWSE